MLAPRSTYLEAPEASNLSVHDAARPEAADLVLAFAEHFLVAGRKLGQLSSSKASPQTDEL